MITRETIEEVRSRMDIVDVVGDFVNLKRSGANFRALSPFSSEKTPSFFVVPAKGIFKDFSSGKGGDAITFIMEHEGLNYPEAIRFLAKKYGVQIKEELNKQEGETPSDREALSIVMEFAKNYFAKQLHETDSGRGVGLSYFHERGFNDRTIQKFELGYSQDSWDGLHQEALRNGYSEEILEKAGLIVKKEGKTYDRFRGRVMFPIHGLSGKVVAFGARLLSKEKQANQPKYLNSPETDLYHKSHVLYGMHLAKNPIRQVDTCYLVEGYTDVVSMHQAGVENVVASSGTALTEDQIKLIKRFTDNVTVLFDGDAAGIKAALRGIDLVLKGGLNARVVLLPDGEDPDSFSRSKSTSEFTDYLKSAAKDFITFKAGLFARESGNDPIKKAESIREIVNSIAVVPDPIKRSVYIQETAHLLKVQESVLISELNKILIHERRQREKDHAQKEPELLDPEVVAAKQQPSSFDPSSLIHYQERETIRLLMNYADSTMQESSVRDYLVHELEDVEFSNPAFKEMYHAFRLQGATLSSDYFLKHENPEIKRIASEMVTSRYHTSTHWADKYHIYFPKENEVLESITLTNVLRLKFRVIQKMMEENLKKVKEAEQADNWELLEEHLTTQQGLKEVERQLAGQLGIVVAK